jgi:hypothetical protein
MVAVLSRSQRFADQHPHGRFRELNDVTYEAMAASMIGGAYPKQGERRAAARWFVEVLLVSRDMGDVPGMGGYKAQMFVARPIVGRVTGWRGAGGRGRRLQARRTPAARRS